MQMATGFADPRHRLHITDGIKWVQDAEEGTYDAIIVDSSDPVGPAEVLFEEVRWLTHPPLCQYPCETHLTQFGVTLVVIARTADMFNFACGHLML